MNEIVKTFLMMADKLMPEMHLKETEFTDSSCDPFTRKKERIEKFMQTGNINFIDRNFVLNMIWFMANQKI